MMAAKRWRPDLMIAQAKRRDQTERELQAMRRNPSRWRRVWNRIAVQPASQQ